MPNNKSSIQLSSSTPDFICKLYNMIEVFIYSINSNHQILSHFHKMVFKY
jgi:hypothetical protein